MKDSLLEQITNAPLVWLTSAFFGGIVLSSLVTLPWWLWLAAGVLGLPIGFVIKRLRPQASLALMLVPAFVFFGGARHAYEQPDLSPERLAWYNDLEQNVYVTGTLAEAPDVRDTYMNLRIDASAIDTGEGDIPVTGTLLVRLTNDYELEYGQMVRVRGQMQTPPENEEFSYRDYLSRQGIHSVLRTNELTLLPFPVQVNSFKGLLARLRASLQEEVDALFPQPESALMNGVLLGIEGGIPDELQQAFKNTGTAHIVAISGFNIAIIAGIFVSLFSRFFGKNIGSILAILGIIFYTLLVGASASVVRAAFMGSLSLIARQFGRRNLALNALFTSGLLMALGSPFVLWDVGFQLSFAATLGLVLYAQPMQDGTRALLGRILPATAVDAIIGPISDYFLLTFAAQITTLPITVYHFSRLSWVSFIANPFILPAQPPVMIVGGLAALLGKLYHPLGQVVAWFAWPFPAYTIRMVEFFDGIPGGVVVLGDFSFLTMLLLYGILLGLTVFWSHLWAWRSLLTSSLVIVVVTIFTVNLWRSAANGPDGRLHITFLDAGSADAVLIKTPDGRFVLINGGSSPSMLGDQLGRRIPPFSHKLDALVIAATQETQVAALPRVLEQYPPDMVLWAGNSQASYSATLLDEWLTQNAVPITQAKGGELLDLGQGATLHLLSVTSRGAVVQVEWGNFKVMMPIGVTYETFEQLENGTGLGPVTALLLAESGYLPSNPPEWLENVNPQMYIISVAAGDFNGLPSPDLLETLENDAVLRTDTSGWIDLTTNGQDVWVSVERK